MQPALAMWITGLAKAKLRLDATEGRWVDIAASRQTTSESYAFGLKSAGRVSDETAIFLACLSLWLPGRVYHAPEEPVDSGSTYALLKP